MRRSAILALACLVACATLVSPAFAASNGMLAAVTADNRIVTLNPDGSGIKTLWEPAVPVGGLSWSPDGNTLALIAGGKLVVWDVPTGKSISTPSAGYSDPVWSADGQSIGVRRNDGIVRLTPSLGEEQSLPGDLQGADAFALSPKLNEFVFTASGVLFWSGAPIDLVPGVAGTPAWSASGNALAFVGTKLPPPGGDPGLYVREPITGMPVFVAPMPARAPRWAPDNTKLLYAAGDQWRTVPVQGGGPTPIPAIAGAGLADWQPCTADTRASCVSYSPPDCTTTPRTVTTKADTPVDLPSCRDPAGLGTSLVVVKAPEHGALSGQRYVPAPGFVGQDTVVYRFSNGFSTSADVTLTIFVVPRPTPGASSPTPTPAVTRAPFLTARATPKLDKKRTALVKVECDQGCSFEIRLTGQLKKPKKTVKGALVKRTLTANTVVSLRLRLPAKPKGKLKTVWITGTVRNGTGESRDVKLPVRLPR